MTGPEAAAYLGRAVDSAAKRGLRIIGYSGWPDGRGFNFTYAPIKSKRERQAVAVVEAPAPRRFGRGVRQGPAQGTLI
jgi:hypothetical protein